jgi:protein TonB
MHMAYLDTKSRPSFGSMAAVVAIHGAVGAALILGLTVSGVIAPPDVPVPTFDVTKDPPPPPPKPTDQPPPDAAKSVPYVPTPQLPLPARGPEIDTTDLFPPQTPPRPLPGPSTGPAPLPSVTPSFAPVAAKPRTNPAGWVTTDDYRSNWIRQEMTGKARFRLEIAADGRVTGCTITGSSGHPQLDAATCALVSKRAKFQPARGSEGEPVAGSYSNAIDWQLPD